MRVTLSILALLALALAGCGTPDTKQDTGTDRTSGDQPLAQTLKVGARGSYTVPVHASVGKGATATSSDETVVRIVDTQLRYLHPERMKPGFTGGDAAQRTFVFEGLAPGTATLTVTKLYRGKVEGTVEIRVTVVK